jgi:hypothetical protein
VEQVNTDEMLKIAELTKEGIELLETGVAAVRKALADGEAKLSEAKARLAQFQTRLQAGDDAADSALDRKFRK